jgi:hypothetical protein
VLSLCARKAPPPAVCGPCMLMPPDQGLLCRVSHSLPATTQTPLPHTFSCLSYTSLFSLPAGALWQFVGTRASSPTPFLAARLVDRGGDAPLLSSAVQAQPERGSGLTAGGVKPGGFWSGAVSVQWLLAEHTARNCFRCGCHGLCVSNCAHLRRC